MRAVDEALDQDEEDCNDDMGDLSDSFESSDEDIELIDFENEITKNLWVPNEAKLYIIYNGKRFVNYNDEQDLMNQDPNSSGDEAHNFDEEDLEEKFFIDNHRTHSEYMTMKPLNRFR